MFINVHCPLSNKRSNEHRNRTVCWDMKQVCITPVLEGLWAGVRFWSIGNESVSDASPPREEWRTARGGGEGGGVVGRGNKMPAAVRQSDETQCLLLCVRVLMFSSGVGPLWEAPTLSEEEGGISLNISVFWIHSAVLCLAHLMQHYRHSKIIVTCFIHIFNIQPKEKRGHHTEHEGYITQNSLLLNELSLSKL